MALATKCPHCNTVFRVAHDQLKLRGGIVRCGACNEVFDGNAALLEPPTPLPVTPLPESVPFDQKMAALDTRAADTLAANAEPLLDLDTQDQAAEPPGAEPAPAPAAAPEPAAAQEPELASAPAEQASAPEPELVATPDARPAPAGAPQPKPAAEPEHAVEPERAAESQQAGESELAAEPEPAAAPLAAGAPEPQASPADISGDAYDDDPAAAPTPFPLPAEPALLPANRDALFDLDLDMESEPDLEASIEPEAAPVPITDEALHPIDTLSDDELEAALEAELAVMEQSLGDLQHGNDDAPPAINGRREPTWDDAALDEPQAGGGPALERAFAAADNAIFSADEEAAPASDDIDAGLANVSATGDRRDNSGVPPAIDTAPPARPLRDDELEEADEEALVQLSNAGLSQAQTASAHAYLRSASAEEAPAHEDHAEAEEPGFVKRDRLRRKYGRAATIGYSLGALLLVLALAGQAVTTFRNTLAAAMPALKPALSAACTTLGCKIELPTQIDGLVIEQGELQTLSDSAFSFTTLLRNQNRSAQAWPSIELTLDDANDKRILRRVFTPRDYLGADAALDKGFAPHSEQAVKLYFELRELKASGYHIAVFYP